MRRHRRTIFGAFLINGVTLDLTGEAKTIQERVIGGTIIVKPSKEFVGLQKTIS